MAGAHDSPLAPSSLAAFARNEDGSAKDPAAFREALLKDPERIKALQVSPDDLLSSSSLLRMAVERTRDKPCVRGGLMIAPPPPLAPPAAATNSTIRTFPAHC